MCKRLFPILLFLIAVPVFAESERPWWKFWNETENTVTSAVENQLFTKNERSILHEYLRNRVLNKHDDELENKGNGQKHKKDKKQKALPPGLQKKLARGGQLPPGWQKKVVRGEVLEGDLYLSSQGLPSDIIDLLPRGPNNTSIRRIEDRVVRVMDATGVILDVLKGQ